MVGRSPVVGFCVGFWFVVGTSVSYSYSIVVGACDDDVGPEVISAPGAACNNNTGICDEAGVCVITSCESLFNWLYNNDNRMCDDQIEQGYCEFLVNSDNNPWNVDGETNCDEFCSAMGGTCLNAWGEDDNSCRKNDSKGCDDRFNDTICRCAPPP